LILTFHKLRLGLGFKSKVFTLGGCFIGSLSYLDLFGSILGLVFKPGSHLEPPKNSTSTNTRQNLIIGQSLKKGNIFQTKRPRRFKVKIPQIIMPPKNLLMHLANFLTMLTQFYYVRCHPLIGKSLCVG
jgi:hypothetical protein